MTGGPTAINSPSTRRSWQEMRRLQRQMEQLIGGLSPMLGWPLTAKDPPINITSAGDHLIIDALCPGVDKERSTSWLVTEDLESDRIGASLRRSARLMSWPLYSMVPAVGS